MSETAADCGHIAHAQGGNMVIGLREHREAATDQRRALDFAMGGQALGKEEEAALNSAVEQEAKAVTAEAQKKQQ